MTLHRVARPFYSTFGPIGNVQRFDKDTCVFQSSVSGSSALNCPPLAVCSDGEHFTMFYTVEDRLGGSVHLELRRLKR